MTLEYESKHEKYALHKYISGRNLTKMDHSAVVDIMSNNGHHHHRHRHRHHHHNNQPSLGESKSKVSYKIMVLLSRFKDAD